MQCAFHSQLKATYSSSPSSCTPMASISPLSTLSTATIPYSALVAHLLWMVSMTSASRPYLMASYLPMRTPRRISACSSSLWWFKCLVPFRQLLTRLNGGSSRVPPVTCVVSNGGMSFTLDVAKELLIPDVLFWTTSACGLMAYMHYHHLTQKGLVPLKGTPCHPNNNLTEFIG